MPSDNECHQRQRDLIKLAIQTHGTDHIAGIMIYAQVRIYKSLRKHAEPMLCSYMLQRNQQEPSGVATESSRSLLPVVAARSTLERHRGRCRYP